MTVTYQFLKDAGVLNKYLDDHNPYIFNEGQADYSDSVTLTIEEAYKYGITTIVPEQKVSEERQLALDQEGSDIQKYIKLHKKLKKKCKKILTSKNSDWKFKSISFYRKDVIIIHYETENAFGKKINDEYSMDIIDFVYYYNIYPL